MTPKTYFDDVWQRCELFVALHGYVVSQATGALQPNALLRAEWAARVSGLDLYVHELLATHLVGIFTGARPACPGFGRFRRNKIVHEGDLQPTVPRIPWPISRSDLADVTSFIANVVSAIDAIV